MNRPFAQSPFVLWVEWHGFYVESDALTVVLDNRTVWDASPELWAKGVVPGIELREARNLAPNARFREWDREASARKARLWLDRGVAFTGRIEPWHDHAAAFDLSGHPRPAEIAKALVRRLAQAPCGALRVGAGPSKWIARLAAEEGKPRAALDDPAAFLAPLSIQRLELVDPAHRDRLEALGYPTIGSVAKLPLDVLGGQFKQAALAIQRAARGLGGDPVLPLYPPDRVVETFPFVEPIEELPVLENAWDRLAERLADRLVGKQADEVELALHREDGRCDEASRTFTRPLHERRGLRTAIRLLFAEIGSRPGSLVGTSVSLGRISPLRPRQTALIAGTARPSPEAAVRSLRETFGKGAVTLASQIELPRRERVLREWRFATGWR